MYSVQEGRWDPQRPSNHAWTPRPGPPSNLRLAHLETATPAKRITFYTSGDNQFRGVRMAIHKRSFKCFDALLDDLSQKVPLPFGVRTVTTPRGTRIIKHLEELQDGGCYLCSDRRQPKPVNMELASKHQSIWHHHSRIPPKAETFSTPSSGHLAQRHRRILLVKNTEPGMRRNIGLSRRSIRSMRAFLEEASEVMQFHVRKIYTTEGRRIDSVQSLMVCPGVLVCVGREALNPMLLKILRKGTEGTLPGLGNKSTGLYPRTPGNGTRSPSFQEARSSPHGPQSRASECSEGQESKKSVNFGLETKKSIIHPRSDSSTRSTRLSLSSEKSYGNGIGPHSQHRPAIMNDDIEKRVLVNKDGSLSVEMRVRFRLCNDETLKWSTQIGKSPSLTSDCYPPSHAHVSCLQNGQSESCSDCATFERDYLDDANQSLHAALDVSQCPCCYQMQGQQYNLWENPIHSQKQTPVSPQYVASHTHTTIRHTHSSCSSSSCNSMRVMRCRAKISSCGRGSDSEQSQLVQEETCVMEQVEQRVDMGQNEDSNVEVCMMSRCSSRSEVVTMNANVSSPCERSLMDEAMEEEVNHPLSRISSSSHVLQSLKEDQDVDDDLPASASQCSHRSKPSSNAQPNDNQSISHFTEHDNLEDRDNIESQTVSETAARDQTITFSSNDTKTGNQSCQESSKANKASNKQHVEKSKIKRSQKDQPERTEVTPACLPNASPNEVVSDWLRSIPAKSNMIAPDEFIENGEEGLVNDVDEPTASKEQHIEDRLDNIQKAKDDEKEGCAAINEGKSTDLAIGVGLAEASPQVNSSLTSGKVLPKDWRSSAAVMKVLLSSSLGRCRSLPEVSPVYGRRLSTSARGLLDCLAQLQLIEPMGCQSCKQHEDRNRQYGDIIAILQSLWLAEPLDIENKDTGKDQGTPPRSSSGVGMSSGSGGSGKEHDNQGGDEAIPKESSHEDDVVENVLEETIKPQTLGFKTEVGLEEQTMHSEEQSQAPPLLDSPKDVNHSSSDKSSTSSATPPPRLLQLSLSNKPSQDPDPVWVLHLLKKLEREFMNHYIDAMAEFKVRWDLEDSLILDTMVAELKDEVNSRIQSSIKREMSKIQSRSGRDGRSPRPPKGTNLSRESTMTEKRRRMLKIMKNQSVKTAESFSDSELTPEFSDQRSDDDYCPCDACVRKKMAARPLKMNPAAVEAPVMMEFDLLKILQLKKTPEKVTAAVSQPTDRCNDSVAIEEVRSLEVVHEEEEEEESSEESKTVLKEPIIGEEKDAKEEAETGEEVIAADDDEEKAEREKENGGEAAERSNDEADGSEEECKATEDTTNQDQEGTTLLEENRHTSISGGADDEDEEQADGGTRESHEKDKLLQQDRASQKAHSATGDVCMMNYEEADAENDSEHPSDTGTNESGNKEDTTEVDRSMVSDNVLLHQFTKSSVESQQGSLED
nr:retinitis pigmentosa 1-like 1 protein [Nerophis lumbriciformis]